MNGPRVDSASSSAEPTRARHGVVGFAVALAVIQYIDRIVYFCLQHVHWRTAFLLFGLLGVAWAAALFAWYRDDPRAHPAVNAAEAALLPEGAPQSPSHLGAPWRRWRRSSTVWWRRAWTSAGVTWRRSEAP